MYTVYSKENCGYCVAAIGLLDINSKNYKVIKVGEDITREEFLDEYPDVRTMPFILAEDGDAIGGFKSLQEHLDQ